MLTPIPKVPGDRPRAGWLPTGMWWDHGTFFWWDGKRWRWWDRRRGRWQ